MSNNRPALSPPRPATELAPVGTRSSWEPTRGHPACGEKTHFRARTDRG